MSVVLNGSSQYLYCYYYGHGGIYPLSISAWFKTSDVTNVMTITSLDNDAGWQNYLQARGDQSGDPIFGGSYQTGHSYASTSTGFSSATWHHALVVYAANNDRRVYIDGGSKGTVATAQNAAGVSDFNIGVRYGHPGGNAPSVYFNGKIAEVAIWHSTLSDANAVSLAAGDLPTTVDASNLDEYWCLLNDANSDNSGTNLTEVGSPTYDNADHPNIGFINMAGTSSITFTTSGVLTYGALSGSVEEKYKNRLVAFGNDLMYYENA